MTMPNPIGLRHGETLPDVSRIVKPKDAYDLWEDYLESTVSQLEDLEVAALAYEQGHQGEQAAAAVRRILHKLKGESGMVGLPLVEHVCHEAETAFDEWAPDHRTDMLLNVKDWIQAVLDHLAETS